MIIETAIIGLLLAGVAVLIYSRRKRTGGTGTGTGAGTGTKPREDQQNR